MVDVKEAQVVVVMVPFLAQSHLNQALELSCQISSFNIPVHYASSATHIHQAKVRFNGLNRLNHAKILFRELPTPHFHSPPPNPNENFPAHLQPSYDASILLREPMASLLREISAKARRVVVIHDVMMAYVVQDVNTLPNVESYSFLPISAFTYFFGGVETGNPSQVEEVPEGLPSTEGTVTPEIANLVGLQIKFLGLASGTIMNSCRSIEGTYIDLYAKQQNAMNKQVWVFGPFNLWALNDDDRRNSSRQHKCLDWLDEQAPNSVLYVSFGTSSSFTDEQIKELATGLEQSQQKFIWVLREADRGDILAGDVKRSEVLPEGFEERVKGVGLVVRDWAPQVEILGHPSTGGFMSHCGWNSCLESITMGVPIAAWPMHSEQPRNAFHVTDILKVGVVVSQWANRNKIVTAPTIATAVNRLMASVEGKEMKKRVMALSDAAQQSVKEGGVSRKELDTFVAYITR